VHVRRAKIVCTLGPASDEQSIVDDLVHAGMDVARLNFSHGTHADHAERIQRIRRAAANVERPVAILQDLCGPKIRAGHFPGGHFDVPTDSRVALVEARGELAYPGEIPITYEGLVEDLEEGDEVLLDDGRVTVRVVRSSTTSASEAVAVARRAAAGSVGVHLPSRRVRISALTEKDKADLAFGLGHRRRLRRAELRAHGRRHQARARDLRGVGAPHAHRREDRDAAGHRQPRRHPVA
jgi:pyruvate kinase